MPDPTPPIDGQRPDEVPPPAGSTSATPSADREPTMGEAGKTILWSVASVLFLVFAATWAIYGGLGLSSTREVARENQEVTVRLTNAVSERLCACVGPSLQIQYEKDLRHWREQQQRSAAVQGGTGPGAGAVASPSPSMQATIPTTVQATITSAVQAAAMPPAEGEARPEPTPPPRCLTEQPRSPPETSWWTDFLSFVVRNLPMTHHSDPTPWQLAQAGIDGVKIPADATFYGSVAALNFDIADERLQMVRSAEESGRKASVFQILIIAIGAMTTMVVSLRTMEKLLSPSVLLGFSIAAILLSALGTGAAGLNAFYSPREVVARQTRSLVQLKQLHQEIHVYLSAERCDIGPMRASLDAQSNDPADARARRVRIWHTRLQQIVGGSDAPVSDASGTGRLGDQEGASEPAKQTDTLVPAGNDVTK